MRFCQRTRCTGCYSTYWTQPLLMRTLNIRIDSRQYGIGLTSKPASSFSEIHEDALRHNSCSPKRVPVRLLRHRDDNKKPVQTKYDQRLSPTALKRTEPSGNNMEETIGKR